MRTLALVLAAPVLLLSATASAHFVLEMPPTPKGSVDGKGAPPCGPDNVDGTVTPVTGGSDLPIVINETVRHGGFYRVALSITSCKDKASCFPTDNKLYDSGNKLLNPTAPGQSDHADYEMSPKFPILADNLLPNPQAGHSRRVFLFKLSLLLNGAVGVVLAIPIVGYLLGPAIKKRANSDSWIALGPLTDFPQGQTRLASFRSPHTTPCDGQTRDIP